MSWAVRPLVALTVGGDQGFNGCSRQQWRHVFCLPGGGTKLPSKTPQMGEVIPRWNGDGVFTGREDKPGESSKRA